MKYNIKYKSKYIFGDWIPYLVVKYRKKGSILYNETKNHQIDLFAMINNPDLYIHAGIDHYYDLELSSYEKRMNLLDKYVSETYNGNVDMYLDDSAKYYTEREIEEDIKTQTANDICNKFVRYGWNRLTVDFTDR